MGVSIQIYRSSIGLYNNCVKLCRSLVYPNHKFFKDGNHNFEYGLHEWSRKLHGMKINIKTIQAKCILNSVLALSCFLHILLAQCNDVHPNPGPNFDYNNINICHCNIRSVKNKVIHIKNELADKYDIIALTETWLTPADKSDKLKLAGYQMPIRRDRDFGVQGYGGVMVWISDKLACKRRKDLELQDIEAMWVEVRSINK